MTCHNNLQMTVPDGSCRTLLSLAGCECIFSRMHSTQCILLHRCFWITSSSDMFRFSTKFCLLPPSRRTFILKIFSSVSNIVSLNPASSWTVCLDSVWVSETFRRQQLHLSYLLRVSFSCVILFLLLTSDFTWPFRWHLPHLLSTVQLSIPTILPFYWGMRWGLYNGCLVLLLFILFFSIAFIPS